MKRLFVLAGVCLLAGAANAATVTVMSLPELTNAIAAANPGDRIVLSSGVYTSNVPIVVTNKGTVRSPITIAAASVGGTEIRGAAGFVLRSPATYLIIEGFTFAHEAPMAVGVGATHCRITRNIFELAPAEKVPYLQVSGDDDEIDCNTFQDKHTAGPMLLIQGPSTNLLAQHTWIHHNFFYRFTPPGDAPIGNNCSALQVGASGRSLSSAFAIVEFNLFAQAAGEEQGAVCNESCDNIYRFNTFGRGTRALSLRNGTRCQVYANFFVGSEGVNISGMGNKIYDNYFEACNPAIRVGNGTPSANLGVQDRLEPVHVTFNTLVYNKTNVVIARGENGASGATNTVFANNIIVGGGKAVSINGPMPKARWERNIVWTGSAGAGDLPASGFTSVDPKLSLEDPQRYHIQTASPAIGKASGGYTYVTMDIDRQPRNGKMDIGADAYSSARGAGANRILTSSDVGPDAPASARSLSKIR